MKTNPNPKCNNDDCAFASEFAPGLTKREYFAAMAMQGLVEVSNPEYEDAQKNIRGVSEMAVKYADALIEELNKEEK